jgi:hypothetical protein
MSKLMSMAGQEFASYDIGGKTYIQKPLVLAQIKQITNLLQGSQIPVNLDPAAILFLLGDKLAEALAVVLVEKGTSLKDKDLEELTKELEFEAGPEVAIEVIEDFFCSNQIASVLERVTKAVEKMKEAVPQDGLMS